MADALLALCQQVGRAALGWPAPEPLPDVAAAGDPQLAPGHRDHLVRHRAGFTGPVLDCHLMSLAEFYGMYLLIWSDTLWPRDPAGGRHPAGSPRPTGTPRPCSSSPAPCPAVQASPGQHRRRT